MNDASPSILIVDDTPANLQLLAGLLKERGYRPRPVPSGKLALQAALAEPPDLVLLDINMPEMNGYQVCERFKGSERLRDIPILFLSALTETVNKVRGFQLGAVDYIAKPFQVEEVEARVTTHLKLRSLQRALQDHNRLLEQRVDERTRELSRANDRLKAVDRLRSEFLEMISHEVRTPSNGLFGICDLMFDSVDFAGREQYVAMFQTSRDRLLQLFDDLEMLTGDGLGALAGQSDDAPLSGLLVEVAEMIGMEILAVEAEPAALLDRPLKGNMAWLLRALATMARLGGCFRTRGQPIPMRASDAGTHLRLEIPLDRLRLRDGQAAEFFELTSAVRTKTAAEPLGMSPVVAQRLLAQLGGTLELTQATIDTGSLVATLPFSPTS
ncbi:transcriptional regulatory protein BaeR [mine drainage metagenome]|uniref:histidine kinase n=1 Tax=mine drainage metagenome TaxID=410659 RepID=A0A1J5U3S5_9ZZZZ